MNSLKITIWREVFWFKGWQRAVEALMAVENSSACGHVLWSTDMQFLDQLEKKIPVLCVNINSIIKLNKSNYSQYIHTNSGEI